MTARLEGLAQMGRRRGDVHAFEGPSQPNLQADMTEMADVEPCLDGVSGSLLDVAP